MRRTIRKTLPTFPTDLTTPGAIEELLLAHRGVFGDARMADDDGDGQDDNNDDGSGDGQDDNGDGSGDGDGQDDDKTLGPKGERALQAEKTKRREAQAQLREWRELGKTPAEIRALIEGKAAAGGEDKVDADAIRAEARREATAEIQRERVLDKIEAKAGRAFADPDDAAALVMRGKKPDHFLDADGNVDGEAIEDALKELLEKKPYLAADAAQRGQKRFGGGADGGARNDSRPKQLTRDDLKRMSPQEIEKARQEGRLNDLLGVKS